MRRRATDMNSMYFAAIINSTFRYATPVLFATLGCLICSRCFVFNVALEGQMLFASFAAIVVNYYTHSVILSSLAAVAAGTLIGLIVAFFQVTLKVRDMVVGTAVNLLVESATSFLMQIVFGTRGTIQGYDMVGLPKISLHFGNLAFLNRMFENLSILDYLGYVTAVLVFIYLFKTVGGFRLRSVNFNAKAADSLGVNSTRIMFNAILVSGALCGLGGLAQCMGIVPVFVEKMTAGRGFIAMGASSLAQAHPLVAMFSSLFFGATISLAKTLQSFINSYFTESLPYICTVIAIAIYGIRGRMKVKQAESAKK